MSIYGKLTKGKDGITYRSAFEAEFAGKFLFGLYDYDYEKPYNDGTKRKSDFYVESLDLWIECSWHQIVETFMYQKKKGRILLDPKKAIFEKKEDVKSLGGKWDSDLKRWYVPELKNTGNRLEQFEKFMYNKDLDKTFSDESHMHDDYEKNMKQKLVDNIDKNIIVVSHKEVSSCVDLWDIIRVVDNSLFMKYFDDGKVDGKLGVQHSKKITKLTYQKLLGEYNKLEFEEQKKFDKEIIKRNFGQWPSVKEVLDKLKKQSDKRDKKFFKKKNRKRAA